MRVLCRRTFLERKHCHSVIILTLKDEEFVCTHFAVEINKAASLLKTCAIWLRMKSWKDLPKKGNFSVRWRIVNPVKPRGPFEADTWPYKSGQKFVNEQTGRDSFPWPSPYILHAFPTGIHMILNISTRPLIVKGYAISKWQSPPLLATPPYISSSNYQTLWVHWIRFMREFSMPLDKSYGYGYLP